MLPSALYAICDADVCARAGWTLTDFAFACLDGGARLLQIRAKEASGGWLLDQTIAIVQRAEPCGALVIVNDRADIARAAQAGGVHVGQEDLDPRSVRSIVGDTAVIGLSTHTLEQSRSAVTEPVSYIAIGPIFGTSTKATGHQPIGLDAVGRTSAIAASKHLPVVAIGGITLDRTRSVIDAGAQSVAVISDLLATGDPRARVKEFLKVLQQ